MKQIEPRAAADMLKGQQNVTFVDVRSRREYTTGHARGAINIPLLEPDAGGRMAPNPDFVATVRERVPPERPVIVACDTGGRARRAATLLEEAGYRDVYHVGPLTEGAEEGTGSVVPGWEATGLPVAYDGDGETLGRATFREMRGKE